MKNHTNHPNEFYEKDKKSLKINQNFLICTQFFPKHYTQVIYEQLQDTALHSPKRRFYFFIRSLLAFPFQILRNLFGLHHQRLLTQQFIATLITQAGDLDDSTPENKEKVARIMQSLLLMNETWVNENCADWSRLYQIEQQMIPLLKNEVLDIELDRRKIEAEKNLDRWLCDFIEKEFKQENTDGFSRERKVALLQRIVNDLHWNYTIREEVRHYWQLYSYRVTSVFLVSILVFGLSLGLSVTSQMTLVMIVGAAGAWGGAFSQLLSVRTHLENADKDDLKILYRFSNVLSRPIIGLGTSVILFFIADSGFMPAPLGIEASIPELFSQTKGTVAFDTLQHLTGLIVLAFIAGFFEKLFPTLISKPTKSA